MKIIKLIACFLCIVIIITAITVLNTAVSHNNNMQVIPVEFQQNMHTVDLFDENFSEIRSRDNIIQDLKDVNMLLNENTYFDFLEINLTSVFKKNENDPETPLKYNCAYFSEDIINYFSLQTENNHHFTSSDLENNINKVPIILGYNYKSQYKIGDEIELIVRGYKTTGYVIDFMLKDEYIIYFNTYVNLNDYFILPFKTMIADEEQDSEIISADEYSFRLLLDKNNGLVVPNGNIDNVKSEIKRISDIYDLPYMLSISYEQEKSMGNNTIIICVLLIVLCATILIICSLIFIKRFRHKKHHLTDAKEQD